MTLGAGLLFPGPRASVPGTGGMAKCRLIVLQSEELREGFTEKATISVWHLAKENQSEEECLTGAGESPPVGDVTGQ